MIEAVLNGIRSEPGVFIFLGCLIVAYAKLVLFALRQADIE